VKKIYFAFIVNTCPAESELQWNKE